VKPTAPSKTSAETNTGGSSPARGLCPKSVHSTTARKFKLRLYLLPIIALRCFGCLALLRARRFVFFRGHPAPTAWTDHNWLFWTRGLVGLMHETRPSAIARQRPLGAAPDSTYFLQRLLRGI
jgi:hypothetical protein